MSDGVRTSADQPETAKVKSSRCSKCGYRVGGANHEDGAHHKGQGRQPTKHQRRAAAKHRIKTA